MELSFMIRDIAFISFFKDKYVLSSIFNISKIKYNHTYIRILTLIIVALWSYGQTEAVLAQTTQARAMWWTVQPIGVAVTETPQEACELQHDAYAPNNPGPITVEPFYLYGQLMVNSVMCNWCTHLDGQGCPIAPLPTLVNQACYDANGNRLYFYKLMQPGVCIKDAQPAQPVCSAGNPSVGNPILISDGVKYDRVEDFSTADGLFKIERHYRSFQGRMIAGFQSQPYKTCLLYTSDAADD